MELLERMIERYPNYSQMTRWENQLLEYKNILSNILQIPVKINCKRCTL